MELIMRILIISDTHTDSIEKLPQSVIHQAKVCDYILHAGDVVGFKLIHDLSHINPNVVGVKGNMDPAIGDEFLPVKRELEFDGVRIGLIHGGGSPYGMENRIMYEFENVDIIVYGHTHKPFWGRVGNVHFLNPGSPTDKRAEPHGTYAILTIEDGKFDAEIHRI